MRAALTDYLARAGTAQPAPEAVRKVLGQIVESTPERRRALRPLPPAPRGLGRVDCASFAIMEEPALTHFFGLDDDFVRAGFVPYR